MRPRFLYLLVMLILLCPVALYAQDAEATESPAADAAQVLAEAQALVDQAEETQQNNLEVANSIMAMIQVGGIFVAVVTGAAVIISGLFGMTSIRDLRKQLSTIQDEINSLEELKHDMSNQLVTVRAEIALLQQAKDDVMQTAEQLSMMNDLPETVDIRMEEQRKDANRQMKALSLVQFAIQQIARGNRHAALNTLARANTLQSDNAVINYFHGEVLVREGDYEQGIRYLEQASQASDMPDANATLAYAYRMMGDENPDRSDKFYSLSESIYLTLREVHPDLLDITGESVYGGLASLYRNRNMIDKAIKIYEEIEHITPNSSYPINNLGLLHFEHDGKPFASREKGRAYFEKARRKANVTLKLEGTDYWRFFDIITAEVALEETSWDNIKSHIDDMFDLDPTDDDILKLIGGIRQLQKSAKPPEFATQAIAYIQSRIG